MKLSSLLPRSLMTRGRVARRLVARAGEKRDQGRFQDAAVLYEEALSLRPGWAAIHVQCAHMFKEAGLLDDAEHHYDAASALTPNDPDLALQIGHFLKVSGRSKEALAAYRRALALRPGWPPATLEESLLSRATVESMPRLLDQPGDADLSAAGGTTRRLVAAAAAGHLIQTDLLPRPTGDLLHAHGEELAMRRLGRPERTFWGVRPTLRGVEAIRGFCISTVPMVEVMILVNGRAVHRGPFAGGFPLKNERVRPDELLKYVFNVWLNFSSYPVGLYEIEVRATDARRRRQSHRSEVVIEAPLNETERPQLDGLVSIDPDDTRSLEDQINGRPSMIRSAQRALFPKQPRTVLVQRIDQLGDMVVSVPALRRLRTIFPEARIIGLLSNANAELAATLDLFDEILVTDFPEDWQQRRRIMPLEKQEDLLRMLAPYQFDVAIDMSENGWARRVLLLSGAPFLYGFRAGSDVPGLTVDLEGNTHDRLNGYEVVPHTNKMLGMMEWLAALARSDGNVVPRTAPVAPALATLDLDPTRRYAVIHDGARLRFSRWPYFQQLARLVLDRTDLDVAMLVDDTVDRDALPRELLENPRFHLMPQRLVFDAFDALLAGCAVFAGNDSGPKHLASLRGSPVVSIHSSRTNWNEWGQESTGFIISRKMPCAGCMLHYDPEECGRNFACVRDITVEEVYSAMERALSEGRPGVSEQ